MKNLLNKPGSWWNDKTYDQKHSFLNGLMFILISLLFVAIFLKSPFQTMLVVLIIGNFVVTAFLAWKKYKSNDKESAELSHDLREKKANPLMEKYDKEKIQKEKAQKKQDDEIIKLMEEQFKEDEKEKNTDDNSENISHEQDSPKDDQ